MNTRFTTWNEVVGLPPAASPAPETTRRPALTRDITLDTQQLDNA
jgi:hypothetical protein